MSVGLNVPRRYWAVAALLHSVAFVCIGSTLTGIALPEIAAALDAPASTTVWIVNAYQLAIVMLLLPFAALSERVGYRLMLQFGLATIVVASIACSLSQSIEVLLAARFIQGIGAAAASSVFGALVRHTYPSAKLGSGMALNTLTVSVATASGSLIGSFVLTYTSWPWIFAANLPIGLVALLLSAFLPSVKGAGKRLDLPSVVLNALAFGPLLVGLGQIDRYPVFAWPLVTMGAVFAVLLTRRSTGVPEPLLPLDLVAIPRLAFASAVSVLSFSAQIIVLITLPFYLLQHPEMTYFNAGLLLAVWPASIGPVALLAGRLSDRHRPEILCLIGSALIALGLCAMLIAVRFLPTDALALGLALCGAGFALFQTPNNRIIIAGAPIERSGGAGGLQAMSREFGLALGASCVGLLFALIGPELPEAGFWLAAGPVAAAIVVNVLRIARTRS